jgi:hypothetical protein
MIYITRAKSGNTLTSQYAVVAEWQTRTVEGRVSNRMGSSPIDRTITLFPIKSNCHKEYKLGYAVVAEWQTRTVQVRVSNRMGSSPIDRTNY